MLAHRRIGVEMAARSNDSNQPRDDSGIGPHVFGRGDLLRSGAFRKPVSASSCPCACFRTSASAGIAARSSVAASLLNAKRCSSVLLRMPGNTSANLAPFRLQEARRGTALDLQRMRQISGGNRQCKHGLSALGASIVGIAIEDQFSTEAFLLVGIFPAPC